MKTDLGIDAFSMWFLMCSSFMWPKGNQAVNCTRSASAGLLAAEPDIAVHIQQDKATFYSSDFFNKQCNFAPYPSVHPIHRRKKEVSMTLFSKCICNKNIQRFWHNGWDKLVEEVGEQ